MRITGLSSGMDIDQLVKDLMKAERMPLDKLKQKKQIIEWKRDDYRTINTLMLDFRNTLTQMKLTDKYRARNVTSTNDQQVSVTAGANAGQSSYVISRIDQLATAATKMNTGAISGPAGKVDASKSLVSQGGNFATGITWETGVVETSSLTITDTNAAAPKLDLNGSTLIADGKKINIKVNGQTYEVLTAGNPATLSDKQVLIDTQGNMTFKQPLAAGSVVRAEYVLAEKIQTTKTDAPLKAWNIGKGALDSMTITIGGTAHTMGPADDRGIAQLSGGIGEVNVHTGAITFNSELAAGTDIKAQFKQKYTAFTVGASTSKGKVTENFLVQGNESLNTVMNKVNSSNVGVSMFYDTFSDKLTMNRKETGDFNPGGNDIETSGAFIDNVLKFAGGAETGGTNAKFTINGLDTERASNTFTMNGVTFTLKQQNITAPITVGVGNDTDKVIDNIKSFVEQYNTLIDAINKKTTEERFRSYQPLTDEQRNELSDKLQEKWDEKAKSGLLKGDSLLTGTLSKMRLDMAAPVQNASALRQLASIGITTTANYLQGGKLEIDETKLRKALEQDPQSVENLFRGNDGPASSRGVVHRLYDTVLDTMSKIQEKAGTATTTNQQFTLGRELIDADKRITRFEERMKQVESRYFAQFSAMEKAIQRANQQSMYLMQQFGGMQ